LVTEKTFINSEAGRSTQEKIEKHISSEKLRRNRDKGEEARGQKSHLNGLSKRNQETRTLD